MRGPVAKARQTGLRQRLLHARVHFRLAQAELLRAKRHVLLDARAEQLIVRVLEHQAHLPADGVEIVRGDRLAQDAHRPVPVELLRQKAVQVQQQRGLAGAIGPEQPHAFALRHAETDPAQRLRAVVITVAEIGDLDGGVHFHPRAHMAS